MRLKHNQILLRCISLQPDYIIYLYCVSFAAAPLHHSYMYCTSPCSLHQCFISLLGFLTLSESTQLSLKKCAAALTHDQSPYLSKYAGFSGPVSLPFVQQLHALGCTACRRQTRSHGGKLTAAAEKDKIRRINHRSCFA